MRRYALRDDQRNRIKDINPGRKESVGVTAKDNRLFRPLSKPALMRKMALSGRFFVKARL